jgi:hypothetical protein
MSIFKVSGFEKSSARNVTWYLNAKSANAAEAHAARGGLVDAEVAEVDLAAVPLDVTLIRADTTPHVQHEPKLSLFWIIVFAVIVGNLATAAIMKLIGSLN